MKLKKTFALLLTLSMVVSIFSPAVAVDEPASETIITTEPAETTEVSAAPAAPAAPAASEAPTETEVPAASEAPVETEAPAQSEAPVETEATAASEAPAETEAPAASEAPAETEAPAASEAPAPSETPAETEAPAASEVPAESQEPTESPAVTETPAVTESPAVTETPVPTETPLVPEVDLSTMSGEELFAYLSTLEGEELMEVEAQLTEEQQTAIREYAYQLVFGDQTAAEDNGTQNMTDAGPLMEAVTGEKRVPLARMMMARNYALLPALLPGAAPDVDGLELNKSIEKDGDDYLLTLEAYATGSMTQSGGEPIPSDIVLVLDQSGSMAYQDFVTQTTTIYNPINFGNRTLYYLAFGGSYRQIALWVQNGSQYEQVTVTIYRDSNWYDYSYTDSAGVEHTGTSHGHDAAPPFTFYAESTIETKVRRLEALQTAVSSFVAAVQADAVKNNVDDRIAIAGFSNDGFNNTELLTGVTIASAEKVADSNPQYYPDDVAYNGAQYGTEDYYAGLSNALQDVSTGEGYANVQDAIHALTAHGGTHTDHGMIMAGDILASNPVPAGETRNRVVILFTDGEPTGSGSSWNGTVAQDAITAAGTVKASTANSGYGATVYTVGIFDGANTADFSSNANKFMHAMSSEYPYATSMANLGERYTDEEGAAPNYYLTASSADALNNVFGNISDTVIGSATSVTLDENAVVQDVLSDYFELIDPSAIRVYTAPCTGGTNTEPTFGIRTEYGSAAVQVNGNTVQVSGFNFSDAATNAVYATPSVHGRELVITIPIRLNNYGFGGNNVPSNTSDTSGVYASLSAADPSELFVTPNVNVPIHYEIASASQTIYLGNSPDLAALLDYAGNFEPDGTNNAYVDIVYTLKNSANELLGTYTIYAGDSVGYWDWEGGIEPTLKPNDCEAYTLSCVVTPTQTGDDSLGDVIVAKTDIADQTPTVHVLKPGFTVASNDVWADYAASVGLQTWGITENGITVGDNWTDSHSEHTAIPAVTGVKPNVTNFVLTFAQAGASDGTLIGGVYTTGEQDADFNITGLTCKVGGLDYAAPAEVLTVTPAVVGDTSHDFTIHINHFNMTITKTLTGNKSIYTQGFLFQVTSTSGDSFRVAIPAANFGTGTTASKTVKNLVCGKTYTVTEDTKWSWRYQLVASSANENIQVTNAISKTAPAPGSAAPAFTNRLDDEKWLSGDNARSNVYYKKS